METKIGAYRVGNSYIRFKKSKNVEKMFQIASSDIGFDVFKPIAKADAESLFNHFGNKCGRLALKQLPENPKEISYLAAHNSIEILADGKNVLSVIKKIRNPFVEMIKTIPQRLIRSIK